RRPAREFPARRRVRTAPGPYPPDLSRSTLEGRKRRFLAYSFPSRSPGPHHLAVLAHPGFVRAAPALPGTTRIRLPSAPPSCCDRISVVGLSPPLESLRFTAHPRSAALLRHRCTQGRHQPEGD